MELVLGDLAAQLERPQTQKFAWPIVLLPELFATPRHLAILCGYLVGIGWEVYVLDAHPRKARAPADSAAPGSAFAGTLDRLRQALAAIGSDVVVVGHGLGGAFALKAAEHPPVRAAIALAPLVPGFRSPLFVREPGALAFWRSASTGPPAGRELFELVADADAFQREQIIKSLAAAETSAAMELARGEVEFARPQTPSLIVAGGSDLFAPHPRTEQLAHRIGARLVTLDGRGHWLIAGRILERAVAEMQRFLVRSFGEELLLLYSDNWGGGSGNS
ncbi:MAG TPA: alpha/beta fold hydrolase [Candidatus Binataceae bacterium]|nr:alpha/beta fold hydrolase [Candidatus Binataceae bacterium]